MLDALPVERVIVVGNDWGATIAWQMALMRPDLVAGVIAFGVPMMGRPPMPPTRLFPRTADAGPRRPGDGTPNPFGMVSRTRGLLHDLPDPLSAPA